MCLLVCHRSVVVVGRRRIGEDAPPYWRDWSSAVVVAVQTPSSFLLVASSSTAELWRRILI